MQGDLNIILLTILNLYRRESSLDEFLSAVAKINQFDEKTIGQEFLSVIQMIDA